MGEEIRRVSPSIDFSAFSSDMEGQWVVVRKSNQQPLGHGHTLEEAIMNADVRPGDTSIAIGRIPSYFAVYST